MGKKSFTLIELLITIVIMAVLTGAIMPMFRTSTEEARRIKAMAELEAIKLAAHLLYADTGYWPTYGYGGASLINATGGGLPGHGCPPDPIPGWKGPYLDTWKRDPWGRARYAILYYDPAEIRAQSVGPDLTLNTADDVVIVITKNRYN